MGFIIATLAVQLASAYFNCTRSNKQASEIAKKQHELEEKILRDGIENCRQEFIMLSSLQRELERQTQQDRLSLIRSNHTKNIINSAYSQSLSTWPLLIPPYVLKRDSLLGNSQISSNYMLPLNCIITTSMNSKFNSKVFTKLEERVAEFCSHNWSQASKKGICFLQNAWRDTITDVGSKIYDLYAHLADVPTLVLSPIIKDDGKLTFRFYWWGISSDDVQHIDDSGNEYDPCIDVRFNTDFKYDTSLVENIINELGNKLSAFISYFADLYYWNFYGYKFTLPALLAKGIIILDTQSTSDYCEEYKKQLIEYVDKYPKVQLDSKLLSSSIQELETITKMSPAKEIITSLMSKEDFMLSSDVRLIEDIEVCLDNLGNDVSVQVSKFKNQLRAKETIITIPCSNTDELFENIKGLTDFEKVENTTCYMRFITKDAFIACVASNNIIYYSHPNARFTLFILEHEIDYSKYLSCELNISTKEIYAVDKQSNPCYNLALEKSSISDAIRANKEYLKLLQNTHKNIEDVVKDVFNRTDTTINIENSLSMPQILDWSKENYINGNEFNLVVGYDKENQLYVYLGCYLNDGEILDDCQYVKFSRHLHYTVLNAMKRKCLYSIKFINHENN